MRYVREFVRRLVNVSRRTGETGGVDIYLCTRRFVQCKTSLTSDT
jgi:hypothetical protein